MWNKNARAFSSPEREVLQSDLAPHPQRAYLISIRYAKAATCTANTHKISKTGTVVGNCQLVFSPAPPLPRARRVSRVRHLLHGPGACLKLLCFLHDLVRINRRRHREIRATGSRSLKSQIPGGPSSLSSLCRDKMRDRSVRARVAFDCVCSRQKNWSKP